MSVVELPYTDAQRLAAADWFVVIRDEIDPNAESIQAWLRWMDEEDGNRAAFDAVARVWHATPPSSALQMPNAKELSADEYDADVSVEEWLRSERARASIPVAARSRISRRAWLAAAAAVTVTAAVLTFNRYLLLSESQADEFTTRTGEQIEITLSDGSHVWLGPKSRLLVDFSKERRGIQLTTGEAFFSVKKDHRRPFTVGSAGGEIVAVGTAFNVRSTDGHVTVAVAEGVVAVTPKVELAAAKVASVRVASGQQLTFIAQQPIVASAIVESPTPGERGRWRDGVLVYRNEPLHEVVRDVVRYSDIQIEIADAAVGDMHYSGVIYDDAVREWVSALPESFPVTIVSDGTREIIRAR
jgi:transmembrane sensor